MQRPAPSLIHVGVITAAHGIRGQVKLRSFTNPPKAILECGDLSNEAGTRTFRITASGGTEQTMIITFEGITDRNEAELLRGAKLYAPADTLPTGGTATGRSELVGFKALLDDGNEYGTVIASHNFGAGDIVEIEKTKGGNEMLPLKEPFVTNISQKTQTLTIQPPEYLETGESR